MTFPCGFRKNVVISVCFSVIHVISEERGELIGRREQILFNELPVRYPFPTERFSVLVALDSARLLCPYFRVGWFLRFLSDRSQFLLMTVTLWLSHWALVDGLLLNLYDPIRILGSGCYSANFVDREGC